MKALEAFREGLELCSRCRCGFCRVNCPIFLVSGVESATARGRNSLALALLDGLIKPSRGLAERFYMCALCAVCEARCPLEVDVDAIVETVRASLVELGLANPYHQKAAENLRATYNPYGRKPSDRARWAEGLEFDPKSKVLLFAGCVYSYELGDVLRTLVDVLGKAGVKVNYLGPEEKCCGYPLLAMGFKKDYDALAEESIKALRATGAERILTACPACASTFGRYKEQFEDFDLEPVHVVAFLKELLDEGALRLEGSLEGLKVAYHDPCHLARILGLTDEPRAIIKAIPGVEFVEMPHHGRDVICCGGGGGLLTAYPSMAIEIAKLRLKEAEEVGANLLVSSCPTCVSLLNRVSRATKSKVKVRDLIGLVGDMVSQKA